MMVVIPEFRAAKYLEPRGGACCPGSRLSARARSGRDDNVAMEFIP